MICEEDNFYNLQTVSNITNSTYQLRNTFPRPIHHLNQQNYCVNLADKQIILTNIPGKYFNNFIDTLIIHILYFSILAKSGMKYKSSFNGVNYSCNLFNKKLQAFCRGLNPSLKLDISLYQKFSVVKQPKNLLKLSCFYSTIRS